MSFHNPFSGYRISQGWTEGSHAANPAIDYPTPIGFAFTAPADGVWRRMPSVLDRSNKSAAGHYGYLELANGDRLYFCHLKRHLAADGARAVKGVTVLAETGNTGFVRPEPSEQRPYLGAHVHTYGRRRNGTRFDWTKDVAPYVPKPKPQPAGQGKPVKVAYNIAQVTTAAVRLRAKPTTTSATLVVIPAAKAVSTGPVVNGWHPVKYGTRTGYVRADFLIARTKTVNAKSGLHLRATASAKARSLAVLKDGTKVTVLATLGKNDNSPWVRVRAGLRTGWVASGYLR